MVHPNYSSTNFVPAKFNLQEKIYIVTFDLGDPDIILSYSDDYDLFIIVSDPNLSEKIEL